ncbi:MAG: OmpA family protein [Bacteroidota bacterium]
MKKLKRFLFLLLAAMIPLGGLYAQEDGEDDKYKNIPKRLHQQKDEYDEGSYLFPPKPKSNWAVGVKGGLAYVAGDVRTRPGAGFGLDLRKALGHVFSLRLQGTFGQTRGLNYRSNSGYTGKTNNPWNDPFPDDPTRAGYAGPVFYNFQMRWADVALQGLVNLNNINFYKEKSKFSIFTGAGIGFTGYNTKVDALDTRTNPDGDLYDFSRVPTFNPNSQASFSDFSDARSQVIDFLTNDLLDGEYETAAEQRAEARGITVGDNFYVVRPIITGVLGIRYRVSRRVSIELEHRIAWTGDDLLDGQRWQEWGGQNGQTALTGEPDSYNQTTLGLSFRIGKGEESPWWSNPLTEVYSTAAETRKILKGFEDDSDQDGVPDLFDKEPDTPEDTPVDGQGRTLDSDGDGVPDNKDDQPYSPKGAMVDDRGIAMDEDGDGVPDINDKEPGSDKNALVDARGITIPVMTEERVREIIKEGGSNTDCLLPMIHFDLNADNVKPEFYPELFHISQVMKADPNVRIQAIGHADVRNTDAYNEDLSRRRVENAVEFLVNTYGIDRSRFETGYEGETRNIIPELPSSYSRQLEPLHYINRRVEFKCIK